MFATLHKSKQLYLIARDRASDYKDLLRVELKIRENQIALRIAGFAAAALFGLLATVFLGIAIIVSFWSTEYRALAAWFVVLLYGAIAGGGIYLALKQASSGSLTSTLRNEFQRDLNVIKESL